MKKHLVGEQDNRAVNELRESQVYFPPTSPTFPHKDPFFLFLFLHGSPPFNYKFASIITQGIVNIAMNLTHLHREVVIVTRLA
jgi:hypothetical protein